MANAWRSSSKKCWAADAVREGARRRAQIALAWLLTRKLWIVPIPCGNHEAASAWKQNVDAVAAVELSADDLGAIEAVLR